MTKILITRHGQTKENVDGTIQGKEHGNVNEKGFEQIKKLIKKLKDEKIDLIISSDIPRCKITTEEILKKINMVLWCIVLDYIMTKNHNIEINFIHLDLYF